VLSWQWHGFQGYRYSGRVNEWDCKNSHGLLAEDSLWQMTDHTLFRL
jgi:hypothetical protein